MAQTFSFTRGQLDRLLTDTIGMFVEYRDKHGRDEEHAAYGAVSEMIDGLDAEQGLAAAGECKLSGQLPEGGAVSDMLAACVATVEALESDMESEDPPHPDVVRAYGLAVTAIRKHEGQPC